MPYQRRYKKSNRRQYGAHSKYSGYLDTAGKALAVAYAVKKLINVEYFNIATAFTSDPNSTGAVVNLTPVAQGDSASGRQGNKIRAKYIKCGGVITLNASATNSRVRMVIVRDNNGSTTQPTIAELFSTASIMLNNRPKLGDAQPNSRFSILWDKMLIMDAGHGLTQKFTWSSSLDHHVFFTGTGATDEGKGHIYLMIVSNEATNDPVVAASANFKYIDN